MFVVQLFFFFSSIPDIDSLLSEKEKRGGGKKEEKKIKRNEICDRVSFYIHIYIAVLQIRCKDYFFESEKFQLKSYYSAGTRVDLSGKMEWIDCNRDIFREAIRIRHVDLTLKKKKETTIKILPDSVSNIIVQSNTLWQFSTAHVFARLSSKRTRTRN